MSKKKSKSKKVAKIVGGVLGALAGVGAVAAALTRTHKPKPNGMEDLNAKMKAGKFLRHQEYFGGAPKSRKDYLRREVAYTQKWPGYNVTNDPYDYTDDSFWLLNAHKHYHRSQDIIVA